MEEMHAQIPLKGEVKIVGSIDCNAYKSVSSRMFFELRPAERGGGRTTCLSKGNLEVAGSEILTDCFLSLVLYARHAQGNPL